MKKMKHVSPRTWLKALRSGEYERCTSTFHDGEAAMCCLGVLMDLSNVDYVFQGNTGWVDWQDPDMSVHSNDGGYYTEDSRPPWLTAARESRLINLNDEIKRFEWEPDGEGREIEVEHHDWADTGVLEYIENIIIPHYDRFYKP